jgi:hypothetical protein
MSKANPNPNKSQQLLHILLSNSTILLKIKLDFFQRPWLEYTSKTRRNSVRTRPLSNDQSHGHGLSNLYSHILITIIFYYKISSLFHIFFSNFTPQNPKISSFHLGFSTGSQSFLPMEWFKASGYLNHTKVYKVRYFFSSGFVGVL